eukprot:3445582-Amphidinium_carterae.1
MIGPFAISHCPQHAAHRRTALDRLQASRVFALNTFFGGSDDFTWMHPSGSLHQIDFILGDSNMYDSTISMAIGEWGLFDLATTSDHRHLIAVFDFSRTRGRAPAAKRKIVRFRSLSHHDAFADAVGKGVLGSWDGICPPEVYLTRLVDQAADFMETLQPGAESPRSPWISATTWNYLLLLNKYRRLSSALQRADEAYMDKLASSIIFHEGHKFFPSEETNAYDGCKVAIKVLSTTTRRMLRRDRRMWFKNACDSLPRDADSGRISPNDLHEVVKKLCGKKGQRPGSRLRKPDGTIAIDKATVASLWMQHWKKHFQADEVEVVDFEDRTAWLRDLDETDGDLPLSDDAYQYTADRVLHVLMRQPKHKATPDLIPAEAWRMIAPQAAEALAQLFTRLHLEKAVPKSFAGARIVGVWKKKGCMMTPSQFRPISLMKFEAKLWSKLLLLQMIGTLRHHRGQYGSGATVGVVYPQLIIHQVTAFAQTRRAPSATIFIDVSAAFDSVLKPYLWGYAPGYNQLDQIGFSGDQAIALSNFLSDHPAILTQSGLPQSIVAILRCWGRGSWFTVDSSSACSSSVGVRQGDNISALVFDIFYGFVMSKLYLELVDRQLLPTIPAVHGRTFRACPDDSVIVGPSAFRDDMAIPLIASDNDILLSTVCKVASIVDAIHRTYHLEVNWARTKTEVTLALRAPSAKPLLQGLKQVGKANSIGAPALALDAGKFLAVAASYQHLGCMHTQDASCAQEVKRMLSKAKVELELKRSILGTKSIRNCDRLIMFSVYVLCHLLLNINILGTLTKVQMSQLTTVFMRGVRICADKVSTAQEVFHCSDLELLASLTFRSYHTYFDRRKLMFFLRLATLECPIVRAAICLEFGKLSPWPSMFAAMNRLRESTGALQELPIACPDTLDQWSQFVIHKHQSWADWVRNYKGVDYPGATSGAQDAEVSPIVQSEGRDPCPTTIDDAPIPHPEDGPGVPCVDADSTRFKCAFCDFHSVSKAGLAMHNRRKHGAQNELSLRTTSSKCPSLLPKTTLNK